MANIFSCGFETGASGGAGSQVSLLGTATVQSLIVRSGNYAVQIGTGQGFMQATVASTTEIFASVWIFITAYPTSLDGLMEVDTSVDTVSSIVLNTNGTLGYNNDAGGAFLGNGSTVIPLLTWTQVELHVVDGAGTGIVEGRINGVVDQSFTGLTNNQNGANITLVGFGPFTGYGIGSNITLDDLICDNAAYPGPAKNIVRQFTTGTPTSNGWTKTGGSGTIDSVWDDTPFSATKFAVTPSQTAAIAQTAITASFSSTQTGHGSETIGAADMINAIQVLGVAKCSSTANSRNLGSVRTTIAGVVTDTNVTMTTADAFYQSSIYTDALANINSSQAGWNKRASTTAGTQTVEDMWVMVTYTPSTMVPAFAFPLDVSADLPRRRFSTQLLDQVWQPSVPMMPAAVSGWENASQIFRSRSMRSLASIETEDPIPSPVPNIFYIIDPAVDLHGRRPTLVQSAETSDFPSLSLLPVSWKEVSVQQSRLRPERFAALAFPINVDAILRSLLTWDFEIQFGQERHPRSERWACTVSVGSVDLPEAAFSPMGWEEVAAQPPRPRPERFGALARGDDGNEGGQQPAVIQRPGGWEVMPPQPPSWPRRSRAGAFMSGDPGNESVELTFSAPGWEVRGVQPGHPRPERAGAIMPFAPGIDGTFGFRAPFSLFGWDVRPPQPPHPRVERVGGLTALAMVDGAAAPFFPAGWAIQPPQPNHPRPERFGAIAAGDAGAEAAMIVPPFQEFAFALDQWAAAWRRPSRIVAPLGQVEVPPLRALAGIWVADHQHRGRLIRRRIPEGPGFSGPPPGAAAFGWEAIPAVSSSRRRPAGALARWLDPVRAPPTIAYAWELSTHAEARRPRRFPAPAPGLGPTPYQAFAPYGWFVQAAQPPRPRQWRAAAWMREDPGDLAEQVLVTFEGFWERELPALPRPRITGGAVLFGDAATGPWRPIVGITPSGARAADGAVWASIAYDIRSTNARRR